MERRSGSFRARTHSKMLRFCFVLASISIHLTLSVNSSEAELLWRLTNQAVHRKQERMSNEVIQSKQQYYHPHYYRPRPSWSTISHTFMEALDAIASNDALHCVPRLLCELMSGQTQTSKDFALPFNINGESLFGLISAVNNPSPVVTFAKAAFLGLSAKRNPSSCYEAYSSCPKDPDKLMQYLNNYNGGFFRFFSGIPRPQLSKRILNNYASQEDKLTFHAGLRSPKTLTFPSDKHTEFQKPPIGHVKVPMVFPDRTGTGELRLDNDELGLSNNDLYEHYNRLKFNKVFRFPSGDF